MSAYNCYCTRHIGTHTSESGREKHYITRTHSTNIYCIYIYIYRDIHKHIHTYIQTVRHNMIRVEDDKLRPRNVINKDYS